MNTMEVLTLLLVILLDYTTGLLALQVALLKYNGVSKRGQPSLVLRIGNMKHNDWTAHAIWKIVELLPQKYIDGSYIENRIIKEEFTLEDINYSFYYAKDVLKSYIYCEWKTSVLTRSYLN